MRLSSECNAGRRARWCCTCALTLPPQPCPPQVSRFGHCARQCSRCTSHVKQLAGDDPFPRCAAWPPSTISVLCSSPCTPERAVCSRYGEPVYEEAGARAAKSPVIHHCILYYSHM